MARARATATRCCSPPERASGRLLARGADAEVVEQFQRALAGGLRSGVVDFERDLHVLQRGEERDEIGLLKNEAEVLAAEGAQVHQRLWPVHHRLAADGDLAGGRRIDQRHRGEQRGLARAAGAEHADDFAARDVQRGIAHGDDLGVAAAIDLAEVRDLDRGRGVGGRGVHAERTVLGSTRMAFQMPSRLASMEMTTTMTARLARSDGSISTRRGKCGKAYWPIHHASP